MIGSRTLIVTADDFGIGPATSKGILELAASGIVTASVLLVNSPHAKAAVDEWRGAGKPMELGWHPCLTLDRPVAPVEKVPSLVDVNGTFWSLGELLDRLCFGQIRPREIEIEFQAQHERCTELLGAPPTVVNTHHHVQVFRPIGRVLRRVLRSAGNYAYLRRVREPIRTLLHVGGARAKRTFLSALGARESRRQERDGFPGNEWLIGITNPECVADPLFLSRWLQTVPGRVVELTCHPGHWDDTLIGRDCAANDGQQLRRVREFKLLNDDRFRQAYTDHGFILAFPTRKTGPANNEVAHAA